VGIFAVFADDDDAIDGEFAGAEGEGVGDGFCDGEVVGGGETLADIAGVELVHPEGGDLEGRVVVLFVDPIAFEEAGDEVIGVAADVIGGAEAGDALFRALG